MWFFSSRLWLWALLLGNSALKNGTNTEKLKKTRKMKGFSTFSQFFPENFVFNAVFPSGSSAEPHPGKHCLETAARSPCAQLLRMHFFWCFCLSETRTPKLLDNAPPDLTLKAPKCSMTMLSRTLCGLPSRLWLWRPLLGNSAPQAANRQSSTGERACLLGRSSHPSFSGQSF